MNVILAIPFAFRLLGLAALGACVGGLLNLGIGRLAFHRQSASPWSPPLSGGRARRWADRVPIVGWLALREEANLYGAGFWIRPLLVELLAGVIFAGLYWFEVGRPELWPALSDAVRTPGQLAAILHLQYLSHVVLISLMIVASFIDIDEKTIPDAITVPGTLIALVLAMALPWSLPLDLSPREELNFEPRGFRAEPRLSPPAPLHPIANDFLKLTSPNPWPAWLDGRPSLGSLGLGLGCFWAWCFALLPRSWRTRHGLARAARIFVARIVRERVSRNILAMAVCGAAGITAVWWTARDGWRGLLTSLVGMAIGGGIVWTVRVVGAATLRKEAMGFGDVTLMAMIGGFLGWQSCLIVFFLSPFPALILGVAQLVLRRGPEIPFGPFLCLATLATIVCWGPIWEWARPLFGQGWLVPLAMAFCMLLLAALLGLWRLVSQALRGA
ncbi:MAG: prepilin peptidase [Pirellulales bacterium]